MLERAFRIRRSLIEFSVIHGHQFSAGVFLTEGEFAHVRDVVGVLRPLKQATWVMERGAFMGSSYLSVRHTLGEEVVDHTPIKVSTGSVSQPRATMPCSEADLWEGARTFRGVVREELAVVSRPSWMVKHLCLCGVRLCLRREVWHMGTDGAIAI